MPSSFIDLKIGENGTGIHGNGQAIAITADG
jgi:hypothetical protein